jgi:glycosyltransferase involved in cell wall biosynthesis
VLFLVEGFTDIRFVVGLSEICRLTMMVPARAFRASGLAGRLAESGARLRVIEIPGGRMRFQVQSMRELWRHARSCDLILSQELLRGSLNANIIGRLRRRPVVAYMGISPLEYFRCRRERGQIGAAASWAGSAVIRTLVAINGRLAARCLAMGPYLRDVASQWCARTEIGLYYGVDVEQFRPADADERARLRRQLELPVDKFLIVLSSRISHEKDPETVLRAAALARRQGLDAVLLNLGGGHREFLALPATLGIDDSAGWLMARPAVHPMTNLAAYFRAADALAMASLAEGAAYSTLEALACGTPVVATSVGGMAAQLRGYARLTPRRDAAAMAEAFLAIAAHPDAARAQALRGREYVCRDWNRDEAFTSLASLLLSLSSVARPHGGW